MFDDDEEDFFSEFAIRSKNITSVKNLILRRDYVHVPKIVNYMTEVIEQMGTPEYIDDFKAHYRMSRDTFYIVLKYCLYIYIWPAKVNSSPNHPRSL